MLPQAPHDPPQETVDDPKIPQDHSPEIQTEKDDADDDYQYSDWASI